MIKHKYILLLLHVCGGKTDNRTGLREQYERDRSVMLVESQSFS